MATNKDTGGQRQTTRRTDETEEDQAASTSSESFSCRSLTSSVDAAWSSSVSSVRRVVCRWPPLSFVAICGTSFGGAPAPRQF